MFIENKYRKCYFSIVDRAKSRTLDPNVYIEKHHIIPKSLGGDNTKENLVRLTAKEHFICHLLLIKMVIGESKNKMVHAAWRMSVNGRPDQHRHKVSSRTYSTLRNLRSEYLKSLVGPLNPNFGRKTGRTSEDFTPEWRAKLSESSKGRVPWNKGIPRTDEVKAAVSKANKGRVTPGFTGRKHSEETKRKIAETFARKRLNQP
jgi:hypothetical protein